MDEFVIGLAGELEVDQTAKNIKNQLDSLSKQVNSDSAKRLSFIGKLNETKTIKVIQEQLDTMSNSLKFEIKSDGLQGIIDSLREVGKVLVQTSQSSDTSNIVNNINKETRSVKELESEYGKLASTRKKYNDIANESPDVVTKTFRDGITTTQVTTNLASDKADTKVVTENFEAQEKAIAKANKAADEYESRLDEIQKKWLGYANSKGDEVNAKYPIANAERLKEGKDLYTELAQSINELRSLSGLEFTETSSQINKKINLLKHLLDSYYNVEQAGNKMRTQSVAVQRQTQIDELSKLEAQWKTLGTTADTELTREVGGFRTVGEALTGFREQLSALSNTDRKGLYDILDNITLFKQQVEAINKDKALANFTENVVNDFGRIDNEIIKLSQTINSSGFSNSPELEQFRIQIQQIAEIYTAAIARINNATNNGQNNEALQNMAYDIKNLTDIIRQRLDQTGVAFEEFQKTAHSAMDLRNLDAKKTTLSNNIEIWLKKNTAATNSTKQALRDLQKQIQGADKETLKNLERQIRNVEKAAEAAGKTGKSFFDTLKSNIVKFTGWYSIGNAISSIRRGISDAIGDLKEMDTLLTEISKTSERTEADLQALGQSAYSAASNYGRTVQDYLSGVLEMSRAGYKNSEAMAELSLKAQAAGDMTAELANQYLIATDAAYKLNGSEEELSEILDGQNKINIIVPLYGNIQRCSLLLSGKP